MFWRVAQATSVVRPGKGGRGRGTKGSLLAPGPSAPPPSTRAPQKKKRPRHVDTLMSPTQQQTGGEGQSFKDPPPGPEWRAALLNQLWETVTNARLIIVSSSSRAGSWRHTKQQPLPGESPLVSAAASRGKRNRGVNFREREGPCSIHTGKVIGQPSVTHANH